MRPGELKEKIVDVIERVAGLGLSREDAAAIVKGTGGNRLSTEKTLALVALDADAVQAQILASPRPVTIQGASSRLRTWDRELGHGKIRENKAVVLFAGGGQAMLLTKAGDAADVQDALRRAFDQATGGSPCTTAHINRSPKELAADVPPQGRHRSRTSRAGVWAGLPRAAASAQAWPGSRSPFARRKASRVSLNF